MHNIISADQRQDTEALNVMVLLLNIIDRHKCLLTDSSIIGKAGGNGLRRWS